MPEHHGANNQWRPRLCGQRQLRSERENRHSSKGADTVSALRLLVEVQV
jgi:hypothetical protein